MGTFTPHDPRPFPATCLLPAGQIVVDTQPPALDGYTLPLPVGFYNMYDYTCTGTLKPNVCMRQGSLQVRAPASGMQEGTGAGHGGRLGRVQSVWWRAGQERLQAVAAD